jgi:hypothetical protein
MANYQQKQRAVGTLTFGDANYNNVFTRDLSLSITGSQDVSGSPPSKTFGADIIIPSGSFTALGATASLKSVASYYIENAGSSSVQLAGTSAGGAITNPIIAPGDWIRITYFSTQGVPQLWAQPVSGSGTFLVYGGTEQ